jgi:serine/threonine-protein kinase
MTALKDDVAELRAGLAGRYEMGRPIGEGAMAVVYVARDVRHDRSVALKVLRLERLSPEGAERFNREIRVAAGLVHPHILPLLDSGNVGGRLWYATPFVEGETLRAHLDREKQLPVEEAIRLSSEIAAGLGHAHARGIIHRDVKPENILLADGRALVADFGIARALENSTVEGLTGTGVTVGTPTYMSPEQAAGDQSLDARSDLYALACVLFEMLAGEAPFAGSTPQALLARRLTQQPPSLRAFRPSVPPALDGVLRRALSLSPADRYHDTGEFTQALEQAGNRRAPAPARARWIVGAAAVVVASVGYALMTREAPAMPRSGGFDDGVRVAVLPLRVIGGDSLDRDLAAGITQELHSTLSNLSGLRVISQTSVEPYFHETSGLRELGGALNAEALLEGDVQRVGSVVRVRVRLVDPVSEESTWSQQYDHTTDDIFRLQSEVATAVAGVLRIQLSASQSRLLSRPPTTNPEAYDLYIRSRSVQMTQGFDAAYSALSRAIELDSTFAQAWGGRANATLGYVFSAEVSPDLWAQAEEDVARAIALDSTLAIAWTARGRMAYTAQGGWRFASALTDYRRALALQPSLIEGRNQLGGLLFHHGFLAEAREQLETSLSLDPRDGCGDRTRCLGFSKPRVARVLWYGQQFEEALTMVDQLPLLGAFVWEKAVVLNALGRTEEAIALLDSSEGQAAGLADREAALGLLHATLGNESEALAHLATAAANPEVGGQSHFHHAQFSIACAYARLGMNAEAVDWLRQTAANGMPNYPLFRNDPNLRTLQGDPEYEALMAELQRQFEAWGRMVRAEH